MDHLGAPLTGALTRSRKVQGPQKDALGVPASRGRETGAEGHGPLPVRRGTELARLAPRQPGIHSQNKETAIEFQSSASIATSKLDGESVSHF